MSLKFHNCYGTRANVNIGQIGRSLGPLVFCSLYWWMGREAAYTIGGTGMIGVTALVFGLLKMPPIAKSAEKAKKTK